MFVKPSDEVLIALARFAKTAEWGVIENWLRANRESCVLASLSPDSDARTRQAQGAVKVLDELIRNTTASEELASRR